MKRRTSFPFLAALAVLAAFAGWTSVRAPEAEAQQQAVPQQAQASSPGDVNERMERLEQRITDLQTVIGTLQTLVRGGAASPAPDGLPPEGNRQEAGGATGGGAPSELSIRVLALETQIRALTGQIEHITGKLDQIDARLGAGAGPLQQEQQPAQPGERQGGIQSPSSRERQPNGGNTRLTGPSQPVPQFGNTAATPPAANPVAPQKQAQTLSSAGAAIQGGSARAVYDASYQSFLRNDLQRAEQGFRNFVNTYPDDTLTGNAYYWLGRTLYDRKQFEPAAKAFLAGYKKDKKSTIAPDSLLHLGKSLTQLGEKDAACSTLVAITKQYPDAPETLKQDTATALKRASC